MKRSTGRRTRRNESGYSMAEVLVATAIFAVIVVAALTVYDRSNRVFKQSLESSDVQQNSRVAFNRLVSDVRMAGFDFDRDGIPAGASVDARVNSRAYGAGTVIDFGGNLYRASVGGTTAAAPPAFNSTVGAVTQDGTLAAGVKWVRIAGANQYQQADEQVELAGRTVITLRGNLDYETDAAGDNGREIGYEPTSGQFPVVTTGNDEIVTYALVSANASKNDDSVSFWADIAMPRNVFPGGSAETQVTIDGIDTELDAAGRPANPPYTLQRITINANGTLTRTPVADNIRSVRYTYFEDQAGLVPLRDLAGANIPTSGVTANTGIVGGAGQFDPNTPTPVPQREIRKKIRAIRVELTGMSPQADRDYTNPDETSATLRRFRTYTLATTIIPRNLGKHGIREQSTTEPGPPTLSRVCRGGCGVLLVEWNAPAVTSEFGAAEQYQIEWGELVGSTINWAGNLPVGAALEGAVSGLDPTKTWYIQVKAINTYGSNTSDSRSIQPINMTQPLPPANVTASSDQVGRIAVSWNEVLTNVSGVNQTCTPSGTLTGDFIRNRAEIVYRVTRNTADTPTGATELWTGDAAAGLYTGSGPTYDAASARLTFVDDSAPNCTPYFYFIEAFDKLCRSDAATNSPNGLTLASSGTSASAQGIAISGDVLPLAPENLYVDASSTCTGSSCNVVLRWPRVIEDAAHNPIKVSKYAVRTITRKAADNSLVDDNEADPDIVVVTDLAQATITWSTGKTKTTGAGEELYFEFQVAAQQCDTPGPVLRSAWIPNPGRKFPCVWSATNTVSVSVSGTPYEGTGQSLASAWTVTDPSAVTVTTAVAVNSVTAVFRVISPVETDAITVAPSTGSTTTSWHFTFPQTPTNGQTWQVDFELTDSSGCKKFLSRYIFDSPTSCCLLPTFFDSNLITTTSRTVTVTLQNICDTAITLQNVGTGALRANWTTGGGNKLDTIKWPGVTAATAVNDNSGIAAMNPPTGATVVIPANSSSYQVTMTWSKNITASTLTGFCATYLRTGATANDQCRVVTPSNTSSTNMTTCN